MSDNNLSSVEVSAKMLSDILHEVAPQKFPPNYITVENYEEKKQEVAKIFTEQTYR